MIVKLEVYYVW